ncbi:MAG: DUF1540 domain-containing protein [Clostridiales bacterium]|nr:DUF1540 domain-containing protein [Clostridiales bacterium]
MPHGNHKHEQHILCNVSSCVYNEAGRECSLDSILVSPCPGGASGDPKDESMCASYSVR